jgi:murein DD-endopeptidase MepM/ murein hydrolase activator NlpD
MAKTITSPLVNSFNNIAAFNSNTKRSLAKMTGEYNSFSNMIKRESLLINQIKLPPKKKINELTSINSGNLFGSVGNLLGSLASGALDVAGFLSNMFPAGGEVGKPKKPAGKPLKPTTSGPRLKFGGIRALGIVNSVFAGLDFATGLQEGESVGQSAAGAGGSLAGSLLGGAIGQALVPIPGVGFVLGSMAGGFLGGYAADRAYEGVTGEKSVEQKQAERLKAQEQLQKGLRTDDSRLVNSLNRFNEMVDKFSDLIKIGGLGAESDIGMGTETDIVSAEKVDDQTGISGEYPGFDNVERVAPFVTGHVSTYPGAQFGAARNNGRIHAGQDIAGQKEGDPVLATMAGTVVEVGQGARWQKGGGSSQTIGIKHKDGSMSRYVHVMAKVAQGQEVKTGQQIGTISPADVWSSEAFPHLHFELYAPGKKGAMDPRPYLKSAPKTPAIAPIKPGTQAAVGPSPTTMKFGANDIESAPSVTIGDSIAKGVKGSGAGTAMEGANPQSVLKMMQSQDLKGKLVKLSSGISNNTSDIATVRQQLQYAKDKGAKGVQLMGTSFDRGDLAPVNTQLQALSNEFPGFVQFAGGFKSTDKVHPNYSEYNQKLSDLLKGGSGGLGVDPSMIDWRSSQGSDVGYYPSYSKPSTSVVLMPVKVGSDSSGRTTIIPASGSGEESPVSFIGQPTNHMVNSVMKSILLTSLAQT